MKYFLAFFKLIRVQNLCILALTQYMVRLFLIGPKENFDVNIFDQSLFFMTCCTCLVAAAGYIVNDYYDIKIDMVNKPAEVVIGNLIPRRISLVIQLIFNILAVLLSYLFISPNVCIFISLSAFLLWLYSNLLKRLMFWGNLTVASLAFASIFMFALYYKQKVEYTLYFSFFAFAFTFLREVVKDMEDMKGDEQFGCKTIPLVIGLSKTKLLVLVLFTATILFLSTHFIILNIRLYLYLMCFVIFPSALLCIKLYLSSKTKDFKFISQGLKVIMLFGVIGVIFS
ncbi:MAG: geranylgeranylglycerol-phosphate geranylgeranyltransferase [Cytophagales bacterium]|nr:geranylgeranylglycerol-phosphate geranylgeranyltransferase [Cytophagales bacterium]